MSLSPLEQLDADIALVHEELKRLRRERRALEVKPLSVQQLTSEVTPAVFAEFNLEEFARKRPFIVSREPRPPRPPRPPGQPRERVPFSGIRVTDLKDELTQQEFEEYLLAKRTEAPTSDFWTKPEEVKAWLISKGKLVKETT